MSFLTPVTGSTIKLGDSRSRQRPPFRQVVIVKRVNASTDRAVYPFRLLTSLTRPTDGRRPRYYDVLSLEHFQYARAMLARNVLQPIELLLDPGMLKWHFHRTSLRSSLCTDET